MKWCVERQQSGVDFVNKNCLTLFWISKLSTMKPTYVVRGLYGVCEDACQSWGANGGSKSEVVPGLGGVSSRPGERGRRSRKTWARLHHSCAPFHVAPTSTFLMAFYGSLESLWLLLTQWDSLLMGDGGAGGEGVSSDGGRAALQSSSRRPCGRFHSSYLESVDNFWTNYSWFWILFVLTEAFSHGVGLFSGLCKMESRISA